MKQLYLVKFLTRTSTTLNYIAAKDEQTALLLAKNHFPYAVVSIYEHLGTVYIK